MGRRLSTPLAEVDLVARRGGELCCVEVKAGRVPFRTRGGPVLLWRPGLRADARRLERLWRAARFLAGSTGAAARVDLVEVFLERDGHRTEVVRHARLRRPLPRDALHARRLPGR